MVLFSTTFANAQVAKKSWDLPSAKVKTLDGKSVDTNTFENDGKPIIISFWATWCKPCVLELNTIMDEYEDWQDETGVKLIAISIDDARNTAKVAPFVNGKGCGRVGDSISACTSVAAGSGNVFAG